MCGFIVVADLEESHSVSVKRKASYVRMHVYSYSLCIMWS